MASIPIYFLSADNTLLLDLYGEKSVNLECGNNKKKLYCNAFATSQEWKITECTKFVISIGSHGTDYM
jgi:hypothetical protein